MPHTASDSHRSDRWRRARRSLGFRTDHSSYTPKYLQKLIADLKADLKDPENAIFGVDLLLPQVGGSARKTNKDYTGGQLDQLVDVIIACVAAPRSLTLSTSP